MKEVGLFCSCQVCLGTQLDDEMRRKEKDDPDVEVDETNHPRRHLAS